MTAPIKVGIVGVGRGQTFARGAGPHPELKFVALCDTWGDVRMAAGDGRNHGSSVADAAIHHVPYPARPSGAPL